MRPGFEDQAAGLRRLLHCAPPQVIASVTFGNGSLRWLATQALMRARAGRAVVAFDEVSSCGNLSDVLGVSSRFDLLQAVDRHVALEDVRVDAAPGLSLYPASRLAQALPGADRLFAGRLSETCRRLQAGADFWLVNSRPGAGRVLSPLAAAAHRMMLVVDGSPRSVTEAYALIKQLEGGPWPQIDVALAAAVASDSADALIANLIDVAQRQTGLAVRRVRGLEASAAAAAVNAAGRDERFLERVLGLARQSPMALSI